MQKDVRWEALGTELAGDDMQFASFVALTLSTAFAKGVVMRTLLFRGLFTLVVAGSLSGCATLRNPSISELRHNPARYQDHTVSINGTVTDAWGIPLVPFKVYKVDDGTGEVTVLSQSLRVPSRGAHVRVKGRVNEVGVLGGQAVGLHLREESVRVR